ncbi:hypothetical protein BJX70DRAFT_402056 [Aspergillus crustosus]
MTSGVAYRCPGLGSRAITPNLFRIHEANLYKAPRSKCSRGKPRSIGQLRRLPLEILHAVFLNLDYTTLNNLRLVNRTARRIIESLPAYALLRNHALETLRAMDELKCSSYFAIGDLFAEFCHPWCRTCGEGEFGALLYLPTLSRSCFKCNLVRGEYQPGLVSDICFAYALSKRDISNKSRPLPIIHRMSYNPPIRPIRIADVEMALELARSIHGSNFEAVQRARKSREKSAYKAYERAMDEWKSIKYDTVPTPRRPRRPRQRVPLRTCDKPDRRSGDLVRSWRSCATIAFPCFDRKTRTVEPGVYCRACTYHWEEMATDWWVGPLVFDPHPPNREARFRAFRERDIPAHFVVCENVRREYDLSERTLEDWNRDGDGEDFFVFPEDWE